MPFFPIFALQIEANVDLLHDWGLTAASSTAASSTSSLDSVGLVSPGGVSIRSGPSTPTSKIPTRLRPTANGGSTPAAAAGASAQASKGGAKKLLLAWVKKVISE